MDGYSSLSPESIKSERIIQAPWIRLTIPMFHFPDTQRVSLLIFNEQVTCWRRYLKCFLAEVLICIRNKINIRNFRGLLIMRPEVKVKGINKKFPA